MSEKKLTKAQISKKLKEDMDKADFQTEKSDEYKWLQEVYGQKKINLPLIKSVCELMSEKIGKEYGSECHSCRKRSCFWIHNNKDEIRKYLAANETEVENPDGESVKLTPPPE